MLAQTSDEIAEDEKVFERKDRVRKKTTYIYAWLLENLKGWQASMLIDILERVRDMMRFQSAIATRIWLDCFDTPSDIIG